MSRRRKRAVRHPGRGRAREAIHGKRPASLSGGVGPAVPTLSVPAYRRTTSGAFHGQGGVQPLALRGHEHGDSGC